MSETGNKSTQLTLAQRHTLQSYVIGFILSLVFTFIPYYMVFYQSIKGKSLLVAILLFAVVQMLIQIIFFLHIGRGPKPRWNLYFFVSTVGIILIVVGGSVFIIDNLIYNMHPSDQSVKLIEKEGIYQISGEKTGACQGQHKTHKVTIKDGQITPLTTYANKCDILMFINEDNQMREMAFGEHPAHEVYAGENLLTVRKGRSKSVTLSETGEYRFHDHLDPDVIGYFTVNNQKD